MNPMCTDGSQAATLFDTAVTKRSFTPIVTMETRRAIHLATTAQQSPKQSDNRLRTEWPLVVILSEIDGAWVYFRGFTLCSEDTPAKPTWTDRIELAHKIEGNPTLTEAYLKCLLSVHGTLAAVVPTDDGPEPEEW
jgi:hypothetical protein